MLVNFDSIHDADEELEAPKEDNAEAEPVVEPEPVIAEPVASEATEQAAEEIEERSNSPSIRTEPSDDEDPLEELKSSSPILVSDQDVEMPKQVAESVPVSVQKEAIDQEVVDANEKAEEECVSEESGPKTVDTEEDIVQSIDIAKVDAAIDELMGDMPILPKDEAKLSQVTIFTLKYFLIYF